MSDEPIGNRQSKTRPEQRERIENRDPGAAKPEDFRKAADELNPPVRVVLPRSGLAVLLRPPNALRVLLVSERLERLGNPESASPGERRQYVELLARLVRDVMVSPEFSLAPGDEGLDPGWLPPEDAEFLLKFALGAVTAEGEDLSRFFRPEPGAAAPGAGRGDVALPAVGAPPASRSGGAAD